MPLAAPASKGVFAVLDVSGLEKFKTARASVDSTKLAKALASAA